jgi:NAD(P)H dehydrogenase (quinone)
MGSGLPEVWADVFVSFDLAARKNLLADVTGAVQKYSGQAPQSLKEFLNQSLR